MFQSKSGECAVCGIVFRQQFRKKFHRDRCPKEKNVVGCIPYLDSYIYFDRNGKFIESDKTRDEDVPYFEGINVKKTVMNEKLPIKDAVLNTAVALSTIFAKNDMIPDYIELDEDSLD